MRSLLLKLHLHPSALWVIFEINFFRNLASAVMVPMLPLYLLKHVGSDENVSLVFLVGYAAAFVSHFFAGHIIEHLKKRKSLLFALAGFTIIFAAFALIKNKPLIFLFFALYQFIFALFIMDVSLYIKHYSNFRDIAENEGKLGAFGNIGWIIGPILGGLIAQKFGFETVFFVSATISLIALFTFFLIRLKGEGVRFHHRRSFAKNITQFFKNKNLRRTYINNAGLGFIYAIWDLLPLLMAGLGASLALIGLTRAFQGFPLAVLEYPIGKMADRETGERKIFILGYFLAALFTISLGMTTDLKLFMIFFFLAAVGTSFLEMTRDAYFFRQMPEKDVELISVYRTSDALPFLIGQLLAVCVLIFLPVTAWFILGGALSLGFVYNAYKLKTLNPKS